MRKGLLGSIAALAASAGLALAQSPETLPLPPGVGPGGMSLPPGVLPGGPAPTPFGATGMPAPGTPGIFNNMGGDPGAGLAGERTYASGDFLLWFMSRMPTTFPLVTTGTAGGGGVPGGLDTATVFGANDFDVNPLIGGRVTLGTWFRRNTLWGFEWSAFVTNQAAQQYRIVAQDQVVARTFIDADTGLPSSFLVSFPGYATGDLTATIRSQIWGSEWNFQRKILSDATRRVKMIGGFRYLDLHEDLSVTSNSFFLPGAAVDFYGQNIIGPFADRVSDSFDTRNQYMAFQGGFDLDWRYKRWTVTGGIKVGLGGVYQTVDVTGESAIRLTAADPETVVLGGLLAVDSNISRQHTGNFVVIPEAKIQATYRFGRSLDLGMGYTFTYISAVLRPSQQIDSAVSTTRVPTSPAYGIPGGVNRPVVPFVQNDLTLQGLNFTATFKY